MNRLFALAAIVLASIGGQTCNAAIVFTGGVADLTFYYASAANRWDVVLQRKGVDGVGTIGTGPGMDSVYGGFTGIVGQSPLNRVFSSLTTNLSTDKFVTVGSTEYAVSRASGSPFFGNAATIASSSFPTSPDWGIRMRLRENQVELGTGENVAANQFASFNLILDVANSTFNGNALSGNADVALLHWDAFDAPIALIDTASAIPTLTANLPNWEHFHRNFGFSQSGEYNLAFQIQGVGGTYGGTAGTGSFSMGFNVSAVPEPSSLSLIVVGFGLAALRRRRRA